jgi:transposase
LLKVYVHPANGHDRWGGQALLEGMDLDYWPRARKVFVDWGYRGLREVARGLGLELEVVERTFAWMGRNRRLGKDYEYHPEVTEAWMYLGMIRLLVKRLARAA